jgi:HAD superfamily hydrolase (TIGR01509 family)
LLKYISLKDYIKKYLERHGFGQFEPKAALFDMDGVLYDSMPNHAIAWQQSMASFGILMTAEDAYATEGARGIDTIRNMLLKQKGETITLERAQEMYDEKTRIFHSMPKPIIMPGVVDVMKGMKARGWRIGVVTGSGQRPLINRLLTDFADFLDEEHIVTAYDVKRGKPAPDPYLMGMKKAGTEPWETIVVENAPLGVKAGVAAQAFTIAVNTGPLADDVLLEAGADLLFPDMFALCKHFGF